VVQWSGRQSLHMMLPAAIMTLLVVSLFGVGTADASLRVGVSEQSAEMFATPAWQSLGLRHVRYLVPWDWAASDRQQAEVDAYMTAARADGQDVLVTFTARRGCFDGRRYSRERVCRAPSANAYRTAVRAFDDRYPWVRTYSAWNEVNHVSQPTFAHPRLAVRYYRVLRRERHGRDFRVMACSTPRTCIATCGRSCAARRAVPDCGDCTTTRTSTTARRWIPAACFTPCGARSG